MNTIIILFAIVVAYLIGMREVAKMWANKNVHEEKKKQDLLDYLEK